MGSLDIGRRLVGRLLVFTGHVAAALVAVSVPLFIVVFDEHILRTTLISGALMLLTVAMVIGGDRLIGYQRPLRRAHTRAAPAARDSQQPFMLADSKTQPREADVRPRRRATA